MTTLVSVTLIIISSGTFGPCLVAVVTDIISPALKWQAGRTASAIRTAASSSLWSATVSAASDVDKLQKIFNVVEQRILGLLSDDSDRTRMFTLRALAIILTSNLDSLSVDFLVKAGKEISDVLDDKNQENREECIRCLGSYLHYTAAVFNKAEEIENDKLKRILSSVISKMTFHMDDDNESFRDIILGCLITLPLNLHDVLREQLEKSLKTHQHKQHIETLLKTVKS